MCLLFWAQFNSVKGPLVRRNSLSPARCDPDHACSTPGFGLDGLGLGFRKFRDFVFQGGAPINVRDKAVSRRSVEHPAIRPWFGKG